ncbi:MAG: phosphate acyltransferase PlsX [Clostridiales bacterium]|jgi:glycerol-3-phosphate acyltransferase PlsX|nr:phosphate acyltransferase PlsX [Clostridiales bacterium]
MIKILIDINGADHSPHALIAGGILALRQKSGFIVVFIGKQNVIIQELCNYNYDKSRVQIIHADDEVTNEDKPTDAVKAKKESSMIKGLHILKDSQEIVGMISAGNTGAYLAGGTLIVGRIPGVNRPALAALVPNLDGDRFCICDAGANVDSKPEFLNQFSVLSTCYVRGFLDIVTPRTALLNNGTEQSKGNELTKSAYDLLIKNSSINFTGNIEGREALTGQADIIVADGMLGNVLLKSIEGTAISIFKMLKKSIMEGGIRSKFGALMLKSTFEKIKTKMDYQTVGGAPLLGLNKIVLKAHGSSNQTSIAQSILDIQKMHNTNIIDNIKCTIDKI